MTRRRRSVERTLPFMHRMIDAMSEAVIAIDQSGAVVAANEAAVRLLDLPDRAAALRPIDEYDRLIIAWHVGEEAFAPAELRRALAGETIPRQVATIVTRAGSERIVEFTATPIRDDRGQVMLAMLVASDVTREQRLRAYWRAVGTVARGISTELNVNSVLDSVLDQTREALGGEVVIGIWRLDETGRDLTLMTHRGLSERTAEAFRSLPLDCPSFICEAARTRQARSTEDTRTASPAYELDRLLVEDEGLASLVTAPLLVAERLLGVLSYGTRAPRRFYEEDLQAIAVDAGLFAVAIDHALLYEESQEARGQLDRLGEEMRVANQRLLTAGLRQHELAEEAERQKAQLNALLENLTEGVTIVDSAGRIVLLNRVGREILPLPEGEGELTLENYGQLDLRRPDGAPLPSEEWPIRRALRGEPFADREVLLVLPDGSQRRILFSGSAVRDDRGRMALAINVYRDVTELRELERAKEEYVSLISHDLRSPLTTVMGHAQLLQRLLSSKGLDSEARSVEPILTGARRMNSMIQELVESARMEAGRLEMHREPTDLCQFVGDVAARVGTAEDQARIRFECVGQAPPVAADAERLERAIVNLVTNALKYSPPEAPVVVRSERRDGEALISVTDQGVGIPPEHLPRLFERFYRVPRARMAEGLGLGLYITRLIVEAHGGRIWVDSEVGKGSTFHIALPIEPGISH